MRIRKGCNRSLPIPAGDTIDTKDSAFNSSGQGIAADAARRIGKEDFPLELLDLLVAKGIDLDGLHDILTDAEGSLIVFVSDQAIIIIPDRP